MDKALDFNDAYDKADKSAPFDTLSDQLSRLGEVIAYRIELEDELVAAMLAPRREG
jgi:regulator of sigma D